MIARKKRILIIVISIVTTILVITGGVFAYLYFGTDLLRSSDELFYKYAMQNADMIKIIDKNWLDSYTQKIENASYTNEGQITFKEKNNLLSKEVAEQNEVSNEGTTQNVQNTETTENTSQIEENALTKFINNTKITFSGKSDLKNEKASQNIKVWYKKQDTQNQEKNENNIQTTIDNMQTSTELEDTNSNYDEKFDMNVVKTGETYGWKSDEVVNLYVAVENNQIKELVEKLGIKDLKNVANKIEFVDYNAIINIQEEKKQELQQRYMSVLKTNISKSRFSKQKKISTEIDGQNTQVNAYALELSESELANIKVKLLEALKDDDYTLSLIQKVKLKDDDYKITIKEKIQEMIDDIKREQSTQDIALKIIVYESERNLVKTEIIQTSKKIAIENKNSGDTQRISITQEETNKGDIVNKYEIIRNSSENENSIELNTKTTENERETSIINIKLINEGNLNNSDNLKTTLNVNTTIENVVRNITYWNEKNFTNEVIIDELNTSNCVVLNKGTIEYNRNVVVEPIKGRLLEVYQQKVESVGLNFQELTELIDEQIQKAKDQFNRDEFEKQVQRALNFVKQDVIIDEELKKEIQAAGTDQKKIEYAKGNRLAKRLNEFGINARIDAETNKVLIDSGYNYDYTYTIDYNKYYIKRAE